MVGPTGEEDVGDEVEAVVSVSVTGQIVVPIILVKVVSEIDSAGQLTTVGAQLNAVEVKVVTIVETVKEVAELVLKFPFGLELEAGLVVLPPWLLVGVEVGAVSVGLVVGAVDEGVLVTPVSLDEREVVPTGLVVGDEAEVVVTVDEAGFVGAVVGEVVEE